MMRKALPFKVIALSLLDAADQPIDYLTFHNNSAPINFTVRLALYLPAPLSAPAAGVYGLVTTSLAAPFPSLSPADRQCTTRSRARLGHREVELPSRWH